MYLFGVSYAIASLSCAIAPFLVVTSSASNADSFASRVLYVRAVRGGDGAGDHGADRRARAGVLGHRRPLPRAAAGDEPHRRWPDRSSPVMSRSRAGTASGARSRAAAAAGMASSKGVPCASAAVSTGTTTARRRPPTGRGPWRRASGVARSMRDVELIPNRREWRAEIPQQIREHLTHGLRFARELGQIVPESRSHQLPESLARRVHARGPSRPSDGSPRSRRPAPPGRARPSESTPRNQRPLEPDQSARRHRGERRGLRRKRVGASRKWPCSSAKRAPIVWPAASRGVSSRASIRASRASIDRRQRRPARNRDQRLLAHGLAARLDAALIVALTGPTEARLQR